MIQITDFRIGNFIWVDGSLQTISMINADDGFEGAPYVGFSGGGAHPYESCSSKRLQAAPLSDGLLRDVGFRASAELRLLPLPAGNGSYLLELEAPEGGTALFPISRRVQHLHQVQNLYYAVCGRELPLHRGAIA